MVKPDHTDDQASRYVFGCPECDYQGERERNSDVIKDIRRKKRVCPKCESRLVLLKDDRPDPPVCPDCGEEALYVKETPRGMVSYVHGIEITKSGGMGFRELDSCFENKQEDN